MAIGQKSDFTIYNPEFHTSFTETLMQNAEAFGEASRGAIVMNTETLMGDFEKNTFFPEISGLVTRRDDSVTTGVTDTAITQAEDINVKLKRKIGPVAQTRDAWRAIGQSNEQISFIVGQQAARAAIIDQLDRALGAAKACAEAAGAGVLTFDATGGTLQHVDLVDALNLFGDNSGSIVAWVMHSKVWHDLIKEGLTNAQLTEVAGSVVSLGTIGSLNRPVIVTDSAELDDAPATGTVYSTFGLTRGALEVKNTEASDIVTEVVTGLENLVDRIQGEYAYNLSVRGFSYTSATTNPNAAVIATAGSWTQIATDVKSTFGVRVLSL